jgi:hypothetical protein
MSTIGASFETRTRGALLRMRFVLEREFVAREKEDRNA